MATDPDRAGSAPVEGSRWASDGPRPLISAAEAHVWLLDPRPWPGLPIEALLGPAERVRLGRLRRGAQPYGYWQVLSTSLLARAALTRAVPDVPPRLWMLGRSTLGRPGVIGPAVRPPVGLSLSHDLTLVACLLVVDTDCGVDVEQLEAPGWRDPAFNAVAAGAEATLGAATDGRRRWVRCAAWALTEAHAKALGTGRGMDPQRCSVIWDGDRVRMAPVAGTETWRHEVLPAGDRHVLAVAVRNPAPGWHLVVHDPAESAQLVWSSFRSAA